MQSLCGVGSIPSAHGLVGGILRSLACGAFLMFAACSAPPTAASPEGTVEASLQELAGSYGWSAVFCGESFDLLPDGTFEWTRGGCTGSTRIRGRLTPDHGVLRMQVTSTTDAKPMGEEKPTWLADACDLIPVRWSGRQYLVPEAEMDSFCQEVNAGWEPAFPGMGTSFLLRAGGNQLQVEGLPDVPTSWRERLFTHPLVGRVLAVDRDGRATLPFGAQDGVQPGMHLMVHFHVASDRNVARGAGWNGWLQVEVDSAQQSKCLTKPMGRHAPRPGELVTGGVAYHNLDPAMWRSVGADARLTFEPLGPVLRATAEHLEQWTASLLQYKGPGPTLDALHASTADQADMLTPAFLNGLRGLDMADSDDIQEALYLLSLWDRFLQAGNREVAFPLGHFRATTEGDYSDAATAQRVKDVETFVLWWRAMACDAERFADYRGQAPATAFR
jgi:hypothetical protein